MDMVITIPEKHFGMKCFPQMSHFKLLPHKSFALSHVSLALSMVTKMQFGGNFQTNNITLNTIIVYSTKADI